MANQTKEPPFVPLNKRAYQQMKANAPSFSQSMLNVTAHMGVKPTVRPLSGTRKFTGKNGQVFQEMDKRKTNKKIVAE